MVDTIIEKIIEVAGVKIEIAAGPIGLSFSGGVDSSLLLYILMSNHHDTIHLFTLTQSVRLRAAAKVSEQVLDRCIELTKNHNVVHHTEFVESGSKFHIMPDQFKKLGLITANYYADTANPPIDIVSTFTAGALMHDKRDPLIQRPIWQPNQVGVPFTNHNKQTIAAMYRELNLIDTLFPLTKSCISRQIKDGHCGHCWWCNERQWGFGRLA